MVENFPLLILGVLQCRPRCTVWTYRYPHTDGLGALYGPKDIHTQTVSVHCMDLQTSTRRRPRCTVWTYRYPHADGLGALYGPTYIHTQSASMHRKEIMLLRALQVINLLRRGGYFETLNPTSLSVSYSKNRKTQTKTARSMNCVSHFKGHSQNCEKRLLASSHLSVCPSSCPHGTNRLPLDGFSWNLSIFR